MSQMKRYLEMTRLEKMKVLVEEETEDDLEVLQMEDNTKKMRRYS